MRSFIPLLIMLGITTATIAEVPEIEVVQVSQYRPEKPATDLVVLMPDQLGPGTTLESLLTAVDAHAPQVIQAVARAEEVRAQQLVATGVFDPVLAADYKGRMTGFYGGQIADVSLSQRLSGLNAEVYSGYRISRGSFPIYEDVNFTNRGGEIRAGARFALLRGRETDPERNRLSNARIKAAAADQTASAQIIGIRAAAMEAYVDWLYAESVRLVYSELYDIANIRDQAIARAVAEGQLATITKDENRQLLLARQSQKINAEQRAMEQALRLSIYLRSQDGQPLRPSFGQGSELPQANPYGGWTQEELLRRTLEARPDFVALNLELKALVADERLASNDMQPDLDLVYEIERDLGDGSQTRMGTDHKVGLNLNVPLRFSRARGALAGAQARIKAARADLRLRQDQASLALQANEAAIVATEQQLQIGVSEVEVARVLREAEERRYLAGASDVFRLNAQETALANSKLRVLSAQRNHDLLLVGFYQITGHLWFN